jgi:hypothetical protein
MLGTTSFHSISCAIVQMPRTAVISVSFLALEFLVTPADLFGIRCGQRRRPPYLKSWSG